MPEKSQKQYTRRQSRSIGALLGLHAGDSLGATLEFQSHGQIAKSYPKGLWDIIGGGHFNWSPGHATDDTDMTRCVLLAYRDLARKGKHFTTGQVRRRAGDYFVDWYEGNWPGRNPPGTRPKDIGNMTAIGITSFRANPDAPVATGQNSAGNGSLMRCLPTAIFQPDLTRLLHESQAISAITHADKRCTIACAAYNACAAALIGGAGPTYAVNAAEAAAVQLEGGETGGDVARAIRLGRKLDIARAAKYGPHKDFFPGACSGYVLETLTIAIAAVLDHRTLEQVLVDVVRIGKDTDTNGAVAGGLLGARDGKDAIPRRWWERLQFADEFKRTTLEILELGIPTAADKEFNHIK
ncbi:hypothetical protein V2G26_005928 [Clonostachys chloroleuca]